MPIKKISLLVIDDDVRMLRMMQRNLELEGYRVLMASNSEAALDILCEETPDLVLLDILMPVMDGYTLCRHIREFSPVPIIMVTGKDSEEDKVRGLDAGADDYITKPFSARELMARVRAELRRSKLWNGRPEPTFLYLKLAIDLGRHKVTLAGEEVDLTATELRLISYLVRNAGRVVTPDQILENVWGDGYAGEKHLLRVNIARLRRKLKDDAKDPRYILTKPGIGYMIMQHT